MRILIVGGQSMLGYYLKQELLLTHEILTSGMRDGVDYNVILGDPANFNNYLRLRDAEKVDVVVHCAASFAGDKAPIESALVNSVGAIQVGEIAKALGCQHLVYVNTIFGLQHRENEYYGFYGLSKRHGEENLSMYCSAVGIKFTSLQLSQVYDADAMAKKHQPLLYGLIERVYESGYVRIDGGVDPLRNYIYVGDVSKIIKQVIEKSVYGIFPCVNPLSYSVSEIIKLIAKVLKRDVEISFDRKKEGLRSVWIPQDSTLYELLRYYPDINLELGIKMICQASRYL